MSSSSTSSIKHINNMGISLNTHIDTLDASISNKVDNLDTSLNDSMSSLDTSISNKVNTLDTSLSNNMNNLNTGLSNVITALNSSLSTNIETLDTSLSNNMNTLDTSLSTNLNSLKTPEQKLIYLLLDSSKNSSDLENYFSIAENLPFVINVFNSPLTFAKLMESSTARKTLFGSATAQFIIRNSTVCLTHLDSIKTVLVTSIAANNSYKIVTSRHCFLLYMSSSSWSNYADNRTRYYKHLSDGITSTTMTGSQNTPNLLNRFMTNLQMYLINSSQSSTRTAHVVYFD